MIPRAQEEWTANTGSCGGANENCCFCYGSRVIPDDRTTCGDSTRQFNTISTYSRNCGTGSRASTLQTTVPTEYSMRPMGDVIPLTRPRGASNSWTSSSLVNEIRVGMRVQRSTVWRQISMVRAEATRSTLDLGSFRRTVVRSGGAVPRPAVAPRPIPFPATESLVAPASPSPT
jgi:hypothetical protein